MANFVGTCENLVIAPSGTATRWVNSTLETADAVRIGITAPAALDAGAYTLQVSFDGINSAGVINDGTNDVAVPAAGKHCQYDPFVAPFWRILAATPAASERVFKLTKQHNAY
jgi:hypothetical protein